MEGRCVKLGNCTLIEYKGQVGSMSWWAKQLGMNPTSIRRRLEKYGPDLEKVLSKPSMGGRIREIEYNGEKHSISQWARIKGISSATLQARLAHGWPVERALTEKVSYCRRAYPVFSEA